MRRALLAQKAPSWVLRGGAVGGEAAALDLDFQNNRYWQAAPVYGRNPSSLLTVSRASTAYQDDLSGNWTSFPSNVLRVANKGALIEESRTNSIRNNSMQGAVAGTPGTVPNNWSLAVQSGLSSQIVGIGTENGIDYLDLRVFGTTNSSGVVQLLFDGSNVAAAAQNQTWTESLFVRLSGGSTTNIIGFTNLLFQYSSGGTLLAGQNSGFTPGTTSLASSRSANTQTLNNASTAFVQSGINFNWASSSLAIDITLRIGWPQLELGAFATSPIRTTGTAVTRAADVVTLTHVPSFGNARTYYAKGTRVGAPAVLSYMLQVSDGTSNNRDDTYADNTPKADATNVAGGLIGSNFGVSGFSLGIHGKIAWAMQSNDQAMVFNGGTIQTGNSATVAAGTLFNRVDLGDNNIGNRQFDGYLERVAIWPTTRVSNAALQTMTAAT